jgi:voltage-gated potassium channel
MDKGRMAKTTRSRSGSKPRAAVRGRVGRRRTRLRAPPKLWFGRFFRVVVTETPFVRMLVLLIVLWLLFSAGLYFTEKGAVGTAISSYGRALYWGVAAFSTAGIADTPRAGASQIVGGIWIVVGSLVFFGTIVATVTAYFMRPLQRPARQIIETIEYNLEHLEDLSVDELDLLKETTDALIDHVERLKRGQ